MTTDIKSAMERIDSNELIKLTLDLANIDSPTGEEGVCTENWIRLDAR
jgi:hypothetical protein